MVEDKGYCSWGEAIADNNIGADDIAFVKFLVGDRITQFRIQAALQQIARNRAIQRIENRFKIETKYVERGGSIWDREFDQDEVDWSAQDCPKMISSNYRTLRFVIVTDKQTGLSLRKFYYAHRHEYKVGSKDRYRVVREINYNTSGMSRVFTIQEQLKSRLLRMATERKSAPGQANPT